MSRKDIYVYPAIFNYAEDGISVSFPDLPGCYSCGWSDEEALRMAREALGVHLWMMEEDEDPIPAPTQMNQLTVEENERIHLVEVYMPLIRQAEDNKSVKKTLTIPAWMDTAAKAQNINFSLLLQQSIMNVLQQAKGN